jgi:hypothetical protein
VETFCSVAPFASVAVNASFFAAITGDFGHDLLTLKRFPADTHFT